MCHAERVQRGYLRPENFNIIGAATTKSVEQCNKRMSSALKNPDSSRTFGNTTTTPRKLYDGFCRKQFRLPFHEVRGGCAYGVCWSQGAAVLINNDVPLWRKQSPGIQLRRQNTVGVETKLGNTDICAYQTASDSRVVDMYRTNPNEANARPYWVNSFETLVRKPYSERRFYPRDDVRRLLDNPIGFECQYFEKPTGQTCDSSVQWE